MIDILSDRVLKKKRFQSAIVLSESSIYWLFLSRQMHHIKQWGTAIQITPLRWWPKFPCQQARSSTTVLGKITPGTPSFCFKHKPLSLLTPFNLYASCQTLYSQSTLLPSPPSLVSLTNYKQTSNIFSVSDHTYNVYALHKTFPIQHDMHCIKKMKAKIKIKAQACPWIAKDILPKIQPKPKSLNT